MVFGNNTAGDISKGFFGAFLTDSSIAKYHIICL